MIERLEAFMAAAVDLAWGLPLVVLLVGGGLYFVVVSRAVPYRYLRHAFHVLIGRYDDPNDPGQISHFQALSTALAATIGVANIGGVAIALSLGGPGAIFWMWVAAFVGMATKYFSCTLSQLYRREDERGTLQGGPMYTIELGLGRRFRPLAFFFCVFGMVGCLPMFQANQMAEILNTQYGVDPVWVGLIAAIVVAGVAFGGVEKIGALSGRLVPAMCVLYLGMALVILVLRFEAIPDVLSSIFVAAFGGQAVLGGAAGAGFQQALLMGVRRAAFSNEAGIGTAPLAHGAAKTDEPVREGLVAMFGPFIDTIVVCSLTAFVILSSGVEFGGELQGVSLTAAAVGSVLGSVGQTLLVVVVVLFGASTMLSYSYYGKKCFGYLFGAQRDGAYSWIYLVGIFLGAIWKADLVINTVDTAFALMAVPNMIGTLWLAPKVVEATKDYFRRLHATTG